MIRLLHLILSVAASVALAVAPILAIGMSLNHAWQSFHDPTPYRRADAVFCVIFTVLCGFLTFFVWRALFSIAMNSHREERGRRWIREGRCPSCGYDTRTTPTRCSECGTRLYGSLWENRDSQPDVDENR